MMEELKDLPHPGSRYARDTPSSFAERGAGGEVKHNSSRLLKSIALLILLLMLSACGGLAGEPRIVSTSALPTVTPTSPPDVGHPTARVSLARGAEIFGGQQGCAACHGIGGKGDGQVASNFSCPLPNFTDAQMARSQTINAWFAITSSGNGGITACLMPPWKSRLDEQQRWDVTSYIYSLHYTPDQLAQGQKLWQSNCAACHGDTGKGDGPKAKQSARPVPNFTDPAYMIGYGDTDLWKTVTNGLGTAMPSFKNQLSDDERWAVVAYARSLNWEPVAATSSTSTQAATSSVPDTPTVKISGKVTMGTPGSSLPPNQPLTLRVIDLSSGSPRDVQTLQSTANADSSFSFGDVQRQINMVYVVTTEYAGMLQTSTPIRMATGSGAAVDLSFLVYETTSDPSVVQVETDEMFVAPFSATSMLVRQGMSFRNSGDRVFVNGRNSVEITLPGGAQQITLDPSVAQQFTVDNGTTIHGVVPLYPGETNAMPLQFSYLLPYNASFTLSMPTRYLIQSLAVHTPQTGGLTPSGAPFAPHDTVQLQDGVYTTYFLQGSVPAGSSIQFSLQSLQDQSVGRRNVLALVLIAAILVLLATGGAIWSLNRQSRRVPVRVVNPADSVIDAIADLDARFERGKISQDDYEAERKRLKAEAAKLLR